MISPEIESFSSSVRVKEVYNKGSNFPWCSGKEYRHDNPLLCLHREILDFVKWIVPTPEEKQLLFITIARIKTAISLLWPDAKIFLVGPTASNSALSGDKIEITIIKNGNNIHNPNPNSTEANTDESQTMEEMLECVNNNLTTLQIFRRSQIEGNVISGIEKPFSFHLDISINNFDGILKAEREKMIFKKIPASFPLLLLMKFFVFQCRIEEKFSHDLVLQMVLFIIRSSPETKKLNLGYLTSHFLKTFGVSFNFITIGITNRNEGRLFNRLDKSYPIYYFQTSSNNSLSNSSSARGMNWKSPLAICVENDFRPGTFFGEDLSDIPTFRSKCFQAYQRLRRDMDDGLDPLLQCFLNRPDFTIRQRADKERQYQVMMGNSIESISLNEPLQEEPRRSFNSGRSHDNHHNENKGREDFRKLNSERRQERNSRYDRNEKTDSQERQDRYDRNNRYDRNDRNDRYDKNDRHDRNDRYDKNDRSKDRNNHGNKYNNNRNDSHRSQSNYHGSYQNDDGNRGKHQKGNNHRDQRFNDRKKPYKR
ncbi:PAP/25A associated domain containing protein [Tritrichomonas foetus]|uniref:PAP/25A associated domain containing protein n=1 Tax=Tritrichomonas foetus TaxID=1144522 RepID=A0A1J4JYW9_9EUKA|nr:PAP/25A associated domain containing protein [Tritrichomonas foetus]|eukprot:OHT04171.1 PAP/25A associated domain containing protein [Tritrichomonas foetus]